MSLLGHTYAGILGILLKEIQKKTFCTRPLAKPFLHNGLKERHKTDRRQSHAKYPVYYTFQKYIFLLLTTQRLRLGLVRSGLIRLGLVRLGLVRLCLVRLGLVRLGLISRLGLVRLD